MRRAAIWLIPLLALAIPAVALAVHEGDGTLSVSRGSGAVVVVVTKGTVLGRFDRGKLVIEDSDQSDGVTPVVYGSEKTSKVNDTTTSYSGTNIRFRVVGGGFKLRLVGMGIDLSTAGRGYATLGPDPSGDNPLLGSYSYNGSSDTLMPVTTTRFALGTSSGS